MGRIIQGLVWAKECSRPECIPQGRVRGVRAVGVRYEKQLSRAVAGVWKGAKFGQWFEFQDRRGYGYCQTDILWVTSSAVWLMECKLSNVEEARGQICDLYLPVLEMVYRRPVYPIIVTRHLTQLPRWAEGSVVPSLADAIGTFSGGRNPIPILPVLHWLGRGPL